MAEDTQREEQAAAAAAQRDTPAALSRRWLLESTDGTLCTVSAKAGLEGYPFGSVVPYALDERGRPVLLLANIAAHTANLRKDPRASLFVRQPRLEGDPQKGWRLTLMGTLRRLVINDDEGQRVTEEEHAHVHARYAERVPEVVEYQRTHGFDYWRFEEMVKVRYIAGFGKICWLEGDDLLRLPLSAEVAGVVLHMNDDHVENMREMCLGLYGLEAERVEMTRLDSAGFFLRTEGPDRLLRFSFGREVDAAELRPAVIDVLRRARQALEAL
jgi:heme iron utilization protein